ncbi:DUF92 domain-containing protein [bacterium]|nr:DUF92 domain-containing protein [bacterium]
MNWTIGGLLAIAVSYASYRFKLLTAGGSVTAFCLGWMIFSLGGLPFSLPILVFFVSSNLISRMGKKSRSEIMANFQKGGQRDAGQVLANGLVPALLLVAWTYLGENILVWLFLVAVAAATADTWATEIGVHSRSEPRSILTFKKVPAGTSGAVSLLGMIGATAGALTIACTGFFLTSRPEIVFSTRLLLIVTVVGVLAQLLDSILGSSIQAQYYCPQCGKVTERPSHCSGLQAVRVHGLAWFDNDLVNLVAIGSGVFLGWLGLTFSG